jgi:hypothetical protein
MWVKTPSGLKREWYVCIISHYPVMTDLSYVVFYDIHGKEGEVLFCSSVPKAIRDKKVNYQSYP